MIQEEVKETVKEGAEKVKDVIEEMFGEPYKIFSTWVSILRPETRP